MEGKKMKHKCSKLKCPICGQRRKEKIIKFFRNNPNIFFSYDDIAEKFNLNFWTARAILTTLERRGIIIKGYLKTKRLTTGRGINVRYTFHSKNIDFAKLTSKHE